MKNRNLEITVGAFLVAGLLAFAFLAIKVSGLSFTTPQDSYHVKAKFDNIAGLTVRARVAVGGVPVGRVTDISLDTDDYMAVVEMAIDGTVRNLTTDSSAAILTSGLLGEKYVGITPGADETFLDDGSLIADTQSSLVLENLIGKFLLNKVDEGGAK